MIARGGSPIGSCRLLVVIGPLAAAACTVIAAEAPSDVLAVAAISATLFFSSCATGQSWSLESMAAPPNYTASMAGLQNFGGYIGGVLAPTVTGFVVQMTGSFIPALLTGAAVAALMFTLVPKTQMMLTRPALAPAE